MIAKVMREASGERMLFHDPFSLHAHTLHLPHDSYPFLYAIIVTPRFPILFSNNPIQIYLEYRDISLVSPIRSRDYFIG